MKLFTIFGNPVKHSISPRMHNLAIKNLNLNACYTRVLLKDGNLLKKSFFDLSLDGANVTVPHKEVAFLQCDEVRGIANKIKAVNTLVLENGKMIGYNTDADGFLESIRCYQNIKKVLIIGAGGTAKALSFIFRENDIDTTILNRSKERLEFFKNNGFDTYSWDEYKVDRYDLVVNTTSAGLENQNLPLPTDMMDLVFANTKYAVDVIYNKNTPFLQRAKEFKIECKDGSDMLLYQGVIAFYLFFDKSIPLDKITDEMKKAFNL